MSCVTPSHLKPIPPIESLNVEQVLERTGSTLWADGRPMEEPGEEEARRWEPLVGYTPPDCLRYSAKSDVAESTGHQIVCRGQVSRAARIGIKFVGGVGCGSGGGRGRRGRGVAPPERDEQESEWADVLPGEMRRKAQAEES